jgi:hypothetical protein
MTNSLAEFRAELVLVDDDADYPVVAIVNAHEQKR